VRDVVCGWPVNLPPHKLTTVPDFYSVGGCRDLFFHAHEDRFTVPRVARALSDLQLDFLGFELADPRMRGLYQQRFPNEPTGRDLGNWARLEQSFPYLFVAMYRFWSQGRS
jgi:hypothetical protein